MKTRAFTLIELLAVIAIIGILAAIMIPVAGSVRRKAHDAVCISNLRQVFMALELYANDNKGKWPDPKSHGGTPQFVPVRYYVDGQDKNGSATPNKALDPYITALDVTMCPVVVKNKLRSGSEMQYWYGTTASAPDRAKTERGNNADPFPNLAWCIWPSYSGLKNAGVAPPHGGGNAMNVLTWNGAVKAIPHTNWRASYFP
ncbi:MAG: prepilin-type N-terminal cleavage/methylation domain-containing protein [Opitutaceae bacterium]|jgi:prepilin-type N-terminal cleavage/methylation domain-containing protein|nr:prepilin-type N-terminal cleavage/methylation domain-containing protein [Opitutaceae bacterium]